ncbi:MAG: LL-diaminopimelate aminotransferase [Candidatus Hydrothermarchaeaceae archaeon]
MLAQRIKELSTYPFVELDRKIEEKRRDGEDIIDLGVGDPDLPTPEHIVEVCCKAAKEPENQRYPSYEGIVEFRGAVASRYERDFGVKVDPGEGVIALLGTKEGIHNINFAFADRGDVVLHPEPGYPVYRTGAIFAGAKAHAMPLLKENSFIPDFDAIPRDVVGRSRIMWINYPNNPTTSVANESFYREAVDFAMDNDLVLCSDEAYSMMAYDDYRPVSLLQTKGADEVCVVFDSLSKTYNMAGWRVGYAVGCSDLIGALKKVKTNVDSGVSQIIQWAAIAALTSSQECVRDNLAVYEERRDIFVDGLNKLGLKCDKPKATFYVWLGVPEGHSSASFASLMLDKAGVVCTPGASFGGHGEGYVRFALTQPTERISQALVRMETIC